MTSSDDGIECELQILAQQINDTLTTSQKQQQKGTENAHTLANCSSSASLSPQNESNFVQLLRSIGTAMKCQNELCFKLLRMGKELAKNSEELAKRNDKLAKENGELVAMKNSLGNSQNKVILLEQKCRSLQQNLDECKEFLNRMAMEDDFRGANKTKIVEEEKENAKAPTAQIAQKNGAAADKPTNDVNDNLSDIIFVDDVIKNKWVAKMGQKVVKNEPSEVIELDDPPNEAAEVRENGAGAFYKFRHVDT